MNTTDQFSKYVMPTYGRFTIEPSHAQGSELWDTSGKRYLDFCTGIAVCSLGHAHPAITETIRQQADKLLHCSNLYNIPQQGELAQCIVEDCIQIPGKVFFSNSGAEANDGLIKSARRFGHAQPAADGTPRFEIISFKNSFHGRTMGSMFATGQDVVHDRFAPIPQGYTYLPYNDCEALEKNISPNTVAILLEPIQGEGGINEATSEFLLAIEAVCKKHNLLLLIDEVQVGFGRCGNMAAWKTIAPELKPDGISWAKGMGGGVPIGAFWLNDRFIDNQETPLSSLMGAKSHGSTYGGNPLVSSVSLTTLKTVINQELCQKACSDELYIKQLFDQWQCNAVTKIKGKGLLLGIELNPTEMQISEGQTPALALCIALNEIGLLTVPAGVNTLRLLPPLNVTKEHIDEAFAMVQQAITSLLK